MARLVEQGHVHGLDMQLVAKDGSTVDVLYSVEYGDYNGEPCFLATVIDINEPRLMEQELRSLNAELEARVAQPSAALIGRAADHLWRQGDYASLPGIIQSARRKRIGSDQFDCTARVHQHCC